MTITIMQVDAFADEAFAGNPAAVCLLDEPADETWMQAMAAEMNLSETAFVVPREGAYDLRWFTPTVEVSLCGHATLASAHALWESGRLDEGEPARFHTASGMLTARRAGPRIEMSLPAIGQDPADPPAAAVEALGTTPAYCGRVHGAHDEPDYLLELDSAAAVRDARPRLEALRRHGPPGLIITAASDRDGCDFVSRYFAPGWGIDEDPVTGSAHCCLAPFWSTRLGRMSLVGYQASRRGGYVHTRVDGDRVHVAGTAVTVLTGVLSDRAATGRTAESRRVVV